MQSIGQPQFSFMSPQTAQIYNLTVDHDCWKIVYSTTGHPGQWNKKTRAFFKDLMHCFCIDDANSTVGFKLNSEAENDDQGF
jgi:hypothetical protein